jgi:hypothetical protein
MPKAQTKLAPGTYRCLADFPPLRKDNRRSTDWRYNPIKHGTLFFYKEWEYTPNDDKPEVVITEQRIYPVGDYEHLSVAPNESTATRDLEESLIRIEDTPSLWLRREHCTRMGLDVLDGLVLSGRLTLADVQAYASIADARKAQGQS